jgi:hypothetical protein
MGLLRLQEILLLIIYLLQAVVVVAQTLVAVEVLADFYKAKQTYLLVFRML